MNQEKLVLFVNNCTSSSESQGKSLPATAPGRSFAAQMSSATQAFAVAPCWLTSSSTISGPRPAARCSAGWRRRDRQTHLSGAAMAISHRFSENRVHHLDPFSWSRTQASSLSRRHRQCLQPLFPSSRVRNLRR